MAAMASLQAAVFPAPAGMNRHLLDGASENVSVPRARGDEPPAI